MDEGHVEIATDDVVWRFERSFLTSNWTCIYGAGCQGILPDASGSLEQGCCSYGAHLGDGDEGRAEALNVAAYASVLDADTWQYHDDFLREGPAAVFSDEHRNHTRIVDGACVFLNRPGFPGGAGCALHRAAIESGEPPLDWKPSVCWQLPIRVDWEDLDDATERATVRRWSRHDWGEFGDTMAWCCTERADGGEAFTGEARVIDSLADELTAIAGPEVIVELRRRLD